MPACHVGLGCQGLTHAPHSGGPGMSPTELLVSGSSSPLPPGRVFPLVICVSCVVGGFSVHGLSPSPFPLP